MRILTLLLLAAFAAAVEHTATWRGHGGEPKVAIPLSTAFANALAAVVAQPGRAWTGTGGVKALPRGFITVDGVIYAYYGFLVHERQPNDGTAWDAPVLHTFWETLGHFQTPADITAWIPPAP